MREIKINRQGDVIMSEIINTIINLIEGKNYTVLMCAITIILLIVLFIILRKATIKSTKVKTKRTNKYIKLLIQYRKNASKATDCSCYYDLLSYVDDNRDYKRIEYYIEHNDNEKIQDYIKSEMYKLRRESLKNADGPDYSIHYIKNVMHRFQIYEAIVLPALLSILIIYCAFMLIFCVASSKNISFVIGLIFVAIILITIIYSFSIIVTERYSFDPIIIKIYYFVPLFVLIIISEISIALNWLSIISIIVYLVFLIVLNHNRKNNALDISTVIQKRKKWKKDMVLGLCCVNDVSKSISYEKDVYTFAYFEKYCLVAVYQYRSIDGRFTRINSFEDVSIIRCHDSIQSNADEYVKKKLKVDIIHPVSSNDN